MDWQICPGHLEYLQQSNLVSEQVFHGMEQDGWRGPLGEQPLGLSSFTSCRGWFRHSNLAMPAELRFK